MMSAMSAVTALADTPGWRDPGRCGVNSLFVLCKLFGAEVKYSDLNALLPARPSTGSSAAELADAAAKSGVSLEVRKVAASRLRFVAPPYILHLDMTDVGGEGHFVTVYANDGETMRYIDGTSGLDMYSSEKILAPHLTGFVIQRSGQTNLEWSTWHWLTLAAGVCGLYQVWLIRRIRSP